MNAKMNAIVRLNRKGRQFPQQVAEASADRTRSEPQHGQAEKSQWVGDKVSDKGQRFGFPLLVEELLEGNLQTLVNRVENAPDG